VFSGGWKSPLYRYDGELTIDVTSSISAGLPAHRCLKAHLLPLVKKLPKHRVLDFGAGALRHTLPLLMSDFEVCAVEYEEAFVRAEAADALEKARKSQCFSQLIWPKQFKKDRRYFDVALLSYVLQVMPEEDERIQVVKYISRKLVDGGYLLYLSRVGQITPEMKTRALNDGYWMWPSRQVHSFYTEFTHEKTNLLMRDYGLKREASWSEGGKEQVFLYRKTTGRWT
jgi:hypothetical protein